MPLDELARRLGGVIDGKRVKVALPDGDELQILPVRACPAGLSIIRKSYCFDPADRPRVLRALGVDA